MNLKTKLYSDLGKRGAARNIFGAVIWPGGRPVIQRAIACTVIKRPLEN